MDKQLPTISIIGAGMAGCFMAILLAKKGFGIDIYERFPDSRTHKIDSGRSYNLTLYYRGVQALKQAGIWQAVKKVVTPVDGNVCHRDGQKPNFTPFSMQDIVLYTVKRRDLNNVLLDMAAKSPYIRIHFMTELVTLDKKSRTMTVKDLQTKQISKHKPDIIIGADGVNSIVRHYMQNGQNPVHDVEYFDWGYKEIHIDPALATKLSLRANATHTWPRKESLFIAFPNPDKSFTLMFNLPIKGATYSFSTLTTKTKVHNYVASHFPDLFLALPAIQESLLKKPLGGFITVNTDTWYYKDFIVIIGDAAHGVLPFYGQGMCAAFEDCNQIISLINTYPGQWETIFSKLQTVRKRNTDVLAELSKKNFVELRNTHVSPYLLMKNKIDTFLNSLFPFWLPPLYMMIAHQAHPYADAFYAKQRQERLAKIFGLNISAYVFATIYKIEKTLLRLFTSKNHKAIQYIKGLMSDII